MLKNKSSREKQTVSLLDFVCLFEVAGECLLLSDVAANAAIPFYFLYGYYSKY
jgi:hypothetical protein